MPEHLLDVVVAYSKDTKPDETMLGFSIMEFIFGQYPGISEEDAIRITEETIQGIREELNRLKEIPTVLQDGGEES